jgi:uncharacterized protein (TIGR02246 family)
MPLKMKPLFVVAAAVILEGCAQTPVPHDPMAGREAAVKAIRDLEAAWVKDANSRDAEKWVAYYADDASVLQANYPVTKGKDAIRTALKQMVTDPALALNFHADVVEVSASADMAYTQGSYEMTTTDPGTKKPVTEKGKYLTVYRKQADGSWKAVEDTQNPDGPPV